MTNEIQLIQVTNVDGAAVVCFQDFARVVRECRLGQVQQELYALVDLHMRLNANLKLCNMPPDTLSHFRFNRLADRVNICSTREEALAAAKQDHS